MKKVIALCLALLMLFGVVAGCGKKEADKPKEDTSTINKDNNSGQSQTTLPDGKKVEDSQTDIENVEVHPSDDATLKVAFHAEPGGLTQAGHAFSSNMNHCTIFADCLVGWDSKTGSPVPNVATEWEWLDDLTLRMYLRDDVTSIIGDPFTAHDVIYTWQWNCEVATLASYYNFFDMERTKAVDDYTVDIALKDPYPFLLIDLAHYCYSLVCEKSIETIGGKEVTQDNPNAQIGPYKLVKWEQGQCVYAERRDDYWGTMPYYKYIELWTVTDVNTRAFGVEAGDYQVAINPSTSSVIAAKDTPGITGWFTGEGGAVTDVNFMLNSDNEYLAIKENRQAIALAINYDSLIQIAVSGNGMKSDNAIVCPTSSCYTAPTNPDNNYVRYDPELAKQKLAEAGNPDGFEITLKYQSGDSMLQSTAELIQNQLKTVGIRLNLSPIEKAAYTADLRKGDFDAYFSGGGNPNPKRNFTFIDPRLSHNESGGSAGQKWYDDQDYIAELCDRCLKTVDDDERMQAFTEINDILMEYVPKIYLYAAYKAILTTDDIIGFNLISMGAVNLKTVYPAEYLEG